MLAEIEVYKREKREVVEKARKEVREQLTAIRAAQHSTPKKREREVKRDNAQRPLNWCHVPIIIDRHVISSTYSLPNWAKWCCEAVCAEYGIDMDELTRMNNSRSVVLTRRVAMLLMLRVANASYPKIGKCLGGMHHTTVLIGVRTLELQRLSDPELNIRINRAELDARLHMGMVA